MKLNQNRVYITLKIRHGVVVRVVSKPTQAAEDFGFTVGDVLCGPGASGSPISIESCELTAGEFREWRLAQQLSVLQCASLYGILPKDVERFEREPSSA